MTALFRIDGSGHPVAPASPPAPAGSRSPPVRSTCSPCHSLHLRRERQAALAGPLTSTRPAGRPCPRRPPRSAVPPCRTRKLRCRSSWPIRRGSPTISRPPARNRGRAVVRPVRLQLVQVAAAGPRSEALSGTSASSRSRGAGGTPVGKVLRGVCLEPLAEGVEVRRPEPGPGRHRVSAVADEQVVARLQRLVQREPGDRPARPGHDLRARPSGRTGSTGRPRYSTIRPATMPTTPGCQSAWPRTSRTHARQVLAVEHLPRLGDHLPLDRLPLAVLALQVLGHLAGLAPGSTWSASRPRAGHTRAGRPR